MNFAIYRRPMALLAAAALTLGANAANAQIFSAPTKPAAPAAPAPRPATAPAAAPAAAPRPAATAAAAPAGTYRVRGFRNAQFGMTRDQVIAAIATDFRITPDKIQTTVNPQDRTTSLVIKVPSIDPGPGEATVTYFIGARTQRLIKVALIWIKAGEPSVDDRQTLLNDGGMFSTYFHNQSWTPNAFRENTPIGPNALVLFVGQDPAGATVEVDAQGINFTAQQDGKAVPTPPAKGPSVLVVSYTLDPAHPDVYQIPPGAF